MDGLSKLEQQEKITAIVTEIVKKIDEVMPEEWDKNAVAAVFNLYINVYR